MREPLDWPSELWSEGFYFSATFDLQRNFLSASRLKCREFWIGGVWSATSAGCQDQAAANYFLCSLLELKELRTQCCERKRVDSLKFPRHCEESAFSVLSQLFRRLWVQQYTSTSHGWTEWTHGTQQAGFLHHQQLSLVPGEFFIRVVVNSVGSAVKFSFQPKMRSKFQIR